MRDADGQTSSHRAVYQRQTLGDLVELQRGYDLTADERQPGSIPVIGGGGANGYHAVANVNGPGVALARSGSGFGNAWWIESDFWAHNTVMFVKNFKGNDPRYTYYVLDWIDFSKHNSGGAQPSLNRNFIYPIPIHIPQLPEQRKIAEILRTWDEALEKLTAFRAAKARRLDGLAAWLIHDEQAERLHLRDFLSEVSTRNHGQQVERVLSVTNSAGFVLAEDQFAHRVASADLSNYKIVRRGQYAYNPSRINVGSIARLDAWEDGALSPMYVVFRVRNGLDSDFFRHWLRSAEARQRIALAAQGSVRETVSFGDLGSILIPVPTIERQQSISRALNAGRGEIALIEAEIEALTRQKRGLMQKLLTGEWRVPLNHAETPIMTEEAEHAG
nr:restriction endonuclease subunit S [Brucella intermedia]